MIILSKRVKKSSLIDFEQAPYTGEYSYIMNPGTIELTEIDEAKQIALKNRSPLDIENDLKEMREKNKQWKLIPSKP